MQTKLLNKKVGLYYGSFNPIHVGHLVVASKALEDTDIDEVWFVVSPQNPHKSRSGELIDPVHRLEMVNLACKSNPRFKVSDIEFNLPQPSYTHMGLRLIREQNKETEFLIIGGTDLQRKMSKWKSHKEIMDNHGLIIYPRNLTGKDAKLPVANELIESRTTHLENVPTLDISATYIRNQIKENKGLDYLVSKEVIEYILKNNLFK